jgi:hypothetical protein
MVHTFVTKIATTECALTMQTIFTRGRKILLQKLKLSLRGIGADVNHAMDPIGHRPILAAWMRLAQKINQKVERSGKELEAK